MHSVSKLYKKQFYIFIFILSFISCDKLLEDSSQLSKSSANQRENTLEKSSLGAEEGNIADYFYDFTDYVEAQYLYYSEPYYAGQASSI